MFKGTRYPAVADSFYPGDPKELQDMIDQLLENVADSENPNLKPPKAIIAPHAGYIYSGPIAATAYAQLAGIKDQIKRIILLGPSHRVALTGFAVSSADIFATPLGDICIDTELIASLLDNNISGLKVNDRAHDQEHSLEVHLPFLQTVLNEFLLVPVVVGSATAETVSEFLEQVWGGPETIIVISSDLSHFYDYQTAQSLDLNTSRAIQNLDYDTILSTDACGCVPIRGLLHRAKQLHLHATTLDCRNSGDTAGSKDRVVGYGSYAIN
jgi:AmmeMemoRadiSam system protein B